MESSHLEENRKKEFLAGKDVFDLAQFNPENDPDLSSDIPSSHGVDTDPVVDLHTPPVYENPFVQVAAEQFRKPQEPGILSRIVRGKKVRPIVSVLYGPPGIGKTTWASKAPSPIFIPCERGADQVGPERFPTPETFSEFRQMCGAIANQKHSYKTLVIDTADGLEPLIWAEVCEEKKVKSIEELKWGEGYTAAKGKWRTLLNSLVRLSEKMNIIILCHSHIKTFNDPALPDPYDMHRLKLHDKSAEVLRDVCDNILFACHEVSLVKDAPKDSKGRGLHSGNRIIRTSAGTGYEAKNRFNLPEEIPLEWAELEEGVKSFYAK